MSFDKDEIENLRKVYNDEHPKQKPVPEGDVATVWATLKDRLHEQCKTGHAECILASMLSKSKAPSSWAVNPEEWLSSDDIDHVEKQYMKVFSKYHYVGSFPIDFDKRSKTGTCLVSSLCSMDIKSLYDSGYRQIGIVFNTDVSTGPGEHWIALFCDINPELEFPRVTYFDSYAHAPEPQIQKLMKRWKKQWDATGIHSSPMQMTYNKTEHQYEDSECGMYCLYFHYCCLAQVPMEQRVPDKVVRGIRGRLFSVSKK